MARLGLLGGTFNPIHLGHLVLAQEVAAQLSLEGVLFIPNRIPPHREDPTADAEDRYRMTCLAIAGDDRFGVCRLELDSPRVSYSYQTVRRLREMHPQDAFTFIAGADSLLRYRWKDLDAMLGLLECFAVASRPAHSPEELSRHLDELALEHREAFRYLRIPLIEISSTAIRRRVREGLPIRYLVPDPVEDYILRRGLYRNTGERF